MNTGTTQNFNSLKTGKRTNDTQLMIEIFAAKQTYTKFKLPEVGYTRGVDKPAAGLSKLDGNEVLQEEIFNSFFTHVSGGRKPDK